MDAQDGVTPTVSIVRSTVAGNQSASAGAGGGIDLTDAGLDVSHSTITLNTASSAGGGIAATGTGPVTLSFVTLVENESVGAAGNLDIDGPLSIGASVIAEAVGADNCAVAGTVTSNGQSQSDDLSCQLTGAGDLAPAPAPMLGALADNGGPTTTRLPLAGSPLRGSVSGSLCDSADPDQRGGARPQGPACEAGAVEVDETPQAVLVAGRAALVSQDRALRAAIESHGFDVASIDDDDLTPATISMLDDADVVVVSSSVAPSKVGDRLNDVTAPILTNEAYHFVELGIASSSGETAPTKNIIVVDSTTGFSGYVGALRLARPLSAGDPVAAASTIAVAPEGDRPVAFTVAPGSALVDGSPAAGPRGAFLLSFRAPKELRPASEALLGHMLGVLTAS
ncbi:MAG: choice-of-anchor Q domain-containing protein, partial [Ilumatobacter sp.]